MEAVRSALDVWGNFYVIIGSSAAALTGLQFVVMAISADNRVRKVSSDTIDAFGTPNVMHFSAVLLLAVMIGAAYLAKGRRRESTDPTPAHAPR